MESRVIVSRTKELLIGRPVWRHEILTVAAKMLIESGYSPWTTATTLGTEFDCQLNEAVEILYKIEAIDADAAFNTLVQWPGLSVSEIAYVMVKVLGINPSYVGNLLAKEFDLDTCVATGMAQSPVDPKKGLRALMEKE